jgi:alpha-tubulin suppressor-like RCC1 family protein
MLPLEATPTRPTPFRIMPVQPQTSTTSAFPHRDGTIQISTNRLRSVAAGLVVAASVSGCGITDPGSQFNGCYDHSCVASPQLVPGLPSLVSLTSLENHTCGLTASGEAWCWGENDAGQLGDGTDQPRATPVTVAGGLRFSSLSTGAAFTCGVTTDHTAYCWGADWGSQLGQTSSQQCHQGSVSCAPFPLMVPIPGSRVNAIAAGVRHACALDSTGSAWCWGFNSLGETGSTAYYTTISAPAKVPGGRSFVSLGAGESFNCALDAAGAAYCWGSAAFEALGKAVPECTNVAGFPNYCSAVPVRVNATATFTTLSVGMHHTCGLTATGQAMCWGDNGQGQLGTSGFENPQAAVVAQSGLTFSTINASSATTCGTPVGTASVCWGLNLFGKLGVGSRIDLSQKPLAVAGGRSFKSFAGGAYHMCALTADGATYCWGSGRSGQLGTGVLVP